ncbi:MAG: hypothetical protein HY985_03425 [Magnetospirillum sp.]|nr:hypothetical protein [Magnetospirillum sp.]
MSPRDPRLPPAGTAVASRAACPRCDLRTTLTPSIGAAHAQMLVAAEMLACAQGARCGDAGDCLEIACAAAGKLDGLL